MAFVQYGFPILLRTFMLQCRTFKKGKYVESGKDLTLEELEEEMDRARNTSLREGMALQHALTATALRKVKNADITLPLL